jgi:hypothetical protein
MLQSLFISLHLLLLRGGTVMVYEINEVNDRPVGKPQEKVLMNIVASFPSVKNQGFIDQERSKQTTKGDATSLRQLRTIYRVPRPSFALLAATRNLHTHNHYHW